MASKRKQWKKEDLERAIESVQNGSNSIRQAALLYNIPKSTLQAYTSTNADIDRRPGPATILTAEEEHKLVQWCIEMAAIGYGQTRQQLIEMVRKIMDTTGRPNPFKDNRPGKDWWYAFLRRHPEISARNPQALQEVRAHTCTPAAIYQWFNEYEQLLLKNDILDKPVRIWNCDESGFPLCPKPGKVCIYSESLINHDLILLVTTLHPFPLDCCTKRSKNLVQDYRQ